MSHTKTDYAERRTHGCQYLEWIGKTWAGRADSTFRRYVELKDPDEAICYFFGSYCEQAKNVVECESGDKDGDLSLEALNATNGQYLGMFQMGTFARSTYGHGNTAIEQARAASLYFFASGRDWSPWGCQP